MLVAKRMLSVELMQQLKKSTQSATASFERRRLTAYELRLPEPLCPLSYEVRLVISSRPALDKDSKYIAEMGAAGWSPS